MGDAVIDTVVVGGGQAGLAAGYHLTRREREFVVLDAAGRPGDSWRHRWDSLRLFTPAGYSHLPGMPFPARHDAFATKDEMADYLASYAERYRIPIEHNTRVECLDRDGPDFVLTSGFRTWRARSVIVATGAHTTPRIPAFAERLAVGTVQLSGLEYRNPHQLPPGRTLVVGAGQSGAEIALDIATRSREHTVLLAGRDVGYLPRWGTSNAVYPPMQLFNRWGARQASKRLTGGDPLVRVRPGDFAEAGVARVSRVLGTREGMPLLAEGDAVEVTAVVWCCGLDPDFGWLRLPIFSGAGKLRQRRGVTDEPGLYVLGMPFQSTIGSHLVGGVGSDAKRVVDHLTRTT